MRFPCHLPGRVNTTSPRTETSHGRDAHATHGRDARATRLERSLDRLPRAAAAFLRGFLVVAVAFDVLDQAFFFAHLLEAPDHLLNRFIASGLDFQHVVELSPFFFSISRIFPLTYGVPNESVYDMLSLE